MKTRGCQLRMRSSSESYSDARENRMLSLYGRDLTGINPKRARVLTKTPHPALPAGACHAHKTTPLRGAQSRLATPDVLEHEAPTV